MPATASAVVADDDKPLFVGQLVHGSLDLLLWKLLRADAAAFADP